MFANIENLTAISLGKANWIFNGPQPAIRVLGSREGEIAEVAKWLRQRVEEGAQPREIGVFGSGSV